MDSVASTHLFTDIPKFCQEEVRLRIFDSISTSGEWLCHDAWRHCINSFERFKLSFTHITTSVSHGYYLESRQNTNTFVRVVSNLQEKVRALPRREASYNLRCVTP